MPKAKAEYCRWHAERMHTLAEQCNDPKLRELVEGMSKNWAEMAVAEDRCRKHD